MGGPTIKVFCMSIAMLFIDALGQEEGQKLGGRNCTGPRICPLILLQVCGSDGKTYSSLCDLEYAKCDNPGLQKEHNGPCSKEFRLTPLINKTLSKESALIRSINTPSKKSGLVQSIKNQLKESALTNSIITAKSIDITLRRIVERISCKGHGLCHLNLDPVCGSDGKTYGNQCSLDYAKCDNPSLQKKHDGPCKKISIEDICIKFCPKSFLKKDIVCGSDGRTYESQCVLDNAICRNPRIKREFSVRCNEGIPGGRFNSPMEILDGINW